MDRSHLIGPVDVPINADGIGHDHPFKKSGL